MQRHNLQKSHRAMVTGLRFEARFTNGSWGVYDRNTLKHEPVHPPMQVVAQKTAERRNGQGD